MTDALSSAFETVRERSGEPLKAVSLVNAIAQTPALLDRLAAVAAALRAHFLTGHGWRFRVHDASLTFFHVELRHRAVKIFVDATGELARKTGVAVKRNPVVVGVELTDLNPFVRELVREYLGRQFGEYYLDPRAPRNDSLHIVSNDKYWIAPHNDHFYDIIFLPGGVMPLKAGQSAVEQFRRRIAGGLRIGAIDSRPS